jgi:hypothetical protein
MRWISVLVITGILLQVMSKPILVAQFLANRQFISATLCINKSDPKIHCKGKCHLKKQMTGDNERQERQQSKENKTVDFWLVRSSGTLISNILTLRPSSTFMPEGMTLSGKTRDIFHPPGS